MESPIMVTGGAGFIGSAVVRRLLTATDHSVVNIDALTYAGNLESIAEVTQSAAYAFERIDICDRSSMSRVFDQYQPRTVLHLAAESHVDRSIDGPAVFVETNVVGTFSLLEAARNFWNGAGRPAGFRLVHVSTDEVFGVSDGISRSSESAGYSPNSPYAATKAAADHLVRAWSMTYGLPVVTTISSNIYGPFQYPDKLIPHMIISALEGRALPVYGDGTQVRNWLHIDDQVDGLLAVAEHGQTDGVYGIGGQEEWQNIEIVRGICTNLDSLRPRADGRSYAEQISHVADRPGHDRRYGLDSSRIREEFGWQPRRDLETGLLETVRWYLTNESWWRDSRTEAYRGERLGLAGYSAP